MAEALVRLLVILVKNTMICIPALYYVIVTGKLLAKLFICVLGFFFNSSDSYITGDE